MLAGFGFIPFPVCFRLILWQIMRDFINDALDGFNFKVGIDGLTRSSYIREMPGGKSQVVDIRIEHSKDGAIYTKMSSYILGTVCPYGCSRCASELTDDELDLFMAKARELKKGYRKTVRDIKRKQMLGAVFGFIKKKAGEE